MEQETTTTRTRRVTRRVLIGTVAGLCLAPVAATAIGAAGGLAGAAALSHGLAVLGGGSLAAGGTGMTGGYLVSGALGALAAASTEAADGYRSRRAR